MKNRNVFGINNFTCLPFSAVPCAQGKAGHGRPLRNFRCPAMQSLQPCSLFTHSPIYEGCQTLVLKRCGGAFQNINLCEISAPILPFPTCAAMAFGYTGPELRTIARSLALGYLSWNPGSGTRVRVMLEVVGSVGPSDELEKCRTLAFDFLHTIIGVSSLIPCIQSVLSGN